MNILFLDDDAKRHDAFLSWMARAQSQQKRVAWLNIFKSASKRRSAEPAHIEAVFTVEAAIQALRDNERFDFAFLDHDLDGRTFVEEREGTGTEVAEYIAASMKPIERPHRIVVHSHNPAGARRMSDILRNRGCEVEQSTFGSKAFVRNLSQL